MKRRICILIAAICFVVGCTCGAHGYHNRVLFQASLHADEREVHLEREGKVRLQASPPGRSFFRPGGILEVYCATSNQVAPLPGDGDGIVVVQDRTGRTVASAALGDFSDGYSSRRGRFIRSPKEFDTSVGGPYTINLEVTRPFSALAGVQQTLSVSHFVSGSEAFLHWVQFGVSALATLAGVAVYLHARPC